MCRAHHIATAGDDVLRSPQIARLQVIYATEHDDVNSQPVVERIRTGWEDYVAGGKGNIVGKVHNRAEVAW